MYRIVGSVHSVIVELFVDAFAIASLSCAHISQIGRLSNLECHAILPSEFHHHLEDFSMSDAFLIISSMLCIIASVTYIVYPFFLLYLSLIAPISSALAPLPAALYCFHSFFAILLYACLIHNTAFIFWACTALLGIAFVLAFKLCS